MYPQKCKNPSFFFGGGRLNCLTLRKIILLKTVKGFCCLMQEIKNGIDRTHLKPQYLFIIVKLLLSAGESSPVKPTQRKATGCLPSLYGLKLHPRYQRSLPAMFRRTIILPLSLRIAANHLLSVKPLRGCGGRRQGRRY